MEQILKDYEMNMDSLVKVRDLMTKEMSLGLSDEEHAKTSIKMLPSFVQTLPSGNGLPFTTTLNLFNITKTLIVNITFRIWKIFGP